MLAPDTSAKPTAGKLIIKLTKVLLALYVFISLIKYDVFQKGLLLLFCGKHSNQPFSDKSNSSEKSFLLTFLSDIFDYPRYLSL